MDDKDNDIENIETDLAKLDEMEKTFHQVVQDLISDHSFDRFRKEYEKLHSELINSHENNRKLMEQCKNLNNSILANANKISSVLTLSQNDQRTIAGLRHEFEKAWKMVEIAQEKEQKSKDTIESLKVEITNLSKLAEQGSATSMSQQQSLQEISDQITALKKEVPVQQAQIDSLSKQIEEESKITQEFRNRIEKLTVEDKELSQNLEQAKTQNSALSSEIKQVLVDLNTVKNAILENQEKVEKINGSINNQINKNKETNDYYFDQRRNLKSADDDLVATANLTKTVTKTLEEKKKQGEKIKALIEKNEKKFEKLNFTCEGLKVRLKALMNDWEDLNYEKDDLKDYSKELESERQKNRSLITQHNDDKLKLINQYNMKKNDNQTLQLKNGQIISENRELRQKTENEKQVSKMRETEATLVNNSILALKEEQHEGRVKISRLDKETMLYEDRAIAAKNGHTQIRDEIKVREANIDKNNIRISELTEGIKKQGNLIDSIQNERDIASRACQDAYKENFALLETNDILAKQIKAFKEDIREKDKLCVETHYRQKQVANDVEVLEKKVAGMRAQLKEMDLKATELKNMMTRSLFLLSSSDIETNKQRLHLNQIKASGEVMQKMTVRHVTERENLLEKCKLIASQINRNKTLYIQQINNIELLKEQLLFEVDITKRLQNQNRHGRALKLEMIHLQKTIVEVMGHSKALEEEIERPRNVHRWRFLESTNPESAQLIRMNIALRDRLMVLMSRLDGLLVTKKKLAEKAKVEEKHLQNSYGGRYDEEYSYYTELLKEKKRMLSQMQQQATIQNGNVSITREQLNNVRAMVREEKTELYESKKMVEQIRAKTSYGRQRNQIKRPAPQNHETKFVGGGFAVGGIATPQSVKRPITRHQAYPQRTIAPNLISPQSITPRKGKSALQVKKTPAGWNPKRQPISPFLPIAANDYEEF